MQADIFGTPAATLRETGGPAYGAAIMAAVGAGMFDSIQEATDQWVSISETVEPDPGRVRLYDELYHRYRDLYPALKDRFARTAGEA